MQLVGVGGQSERDVRPAPPGHVLSDAVDVEGQGIQTDAHEITGHAQRLGTKVRWHRGAGIAQVGGREVDEMSPVGTLDNGGQGGVGGDGWVGGQNGTVEFVEPFLGRVQRDTRCLADQLMYSR